MGRRKNQEDRFLVVPDLMNGEYTFAGVFDGTVKEYASDFVHQHILNELLASPSFQRYQALSTVEKTVAANRKLLEVTVLT